jgi:hypothetical protein
MAGFVGSWDVQISTVIGRMPVRIDVSEDDGVLVGIAHGKEESVPLHHITSTPTAAGGQRVTWSQQIRRPMRLNLDFDVTVEGDRMSGVSRAGRLPQSTVHGVRRADGPGPATG